MSEKPLCGFCNRTFTKETCDFGKCITEFHKKLREAKRLFSERLEDLRREIKDTPKGCDSRAGLEAEADEIEAWINGVLSL